MNYVYAKDQPALIAWAARKIGIERFKLDAVAIGLVSEAGEIQAVVVYDTFSTTDCHTHIAASGKNWMNRAFLRAIFDYPFNQCGLRRITGVVDEDNAEALRFDEHLGFKREGYHPESTDDGKAVITLGMVRKDCRFLGGK